jgi:type IV secretory pathway VirD2 relaxase
VSSSKALVVRHQGHAFRSAPLPAHVAYLERDGVTRDGEKGCMFGAAGDRTDAIAFAERGLNEPSIFVVTSGDRRDDRL